MLEAGEGQFFGVDLLSRGSTAPAPRARRANPLPNGYQPVLPRLLPCLVPFGRHAVEPVLWLAVGIPKRHPDEGCWASFGMLLLSGEIQAPPQDQM